MNIQTDHYTLDLPDAHAADILASIDDADIRQTILDIVDAAPDGAPVQMPVEYGDVVLAAQSAWERAREGGA